MPDKKISQLTGGGAAAASDKFVVARGGANFSIEGTAVAAAATSVGTLTSLAVSGSLTTPATITSSGASTSVAINNTNVNAWGSNLAIQTGGTPAGYFGTIGSLLGSTTQDLAVYATSGNGFRVYTNGNNLRLQVDSTGNLAVDTNTLYVDATNNRVGVGTATPATALDVTGLFNGLQARFGNTAGRGLYVSTALNGGTNEGSTVLDARGASSGQFLFQTDSVTRATLDTTGNLGIGVTPSAWTNSYKGIELSGAALTSNDTTSTFYLQNAYVNGGQFLYKASAFASAYGQSTGVHAWYRAPSGTAGNAITFTTAMTLDASGNLGIGTATPAKKLDVTVATAATLAATDDGLRVLNATTRAALGVTGSSYVYGGAGADAALLYSLSRLSIMADTANPITFHTGTAAPVERMRLDSTGNLGIGGTPGAYRLDVVGSMRCYGDVLSSATSVSTFGTLTNQSLRLATNNTFRVNIDTSGNVCLNTSSVGTSAVGVLGIANGTAPSSSPAGMGQLYVESGALKYRGSSGTVTTIANA